MSAADPIRGAHVIRPSSGWSSLDLREVWRYRELLYFLIWRDVKVRYKQTFFGAAWALLQPVMFMIVFTIFFGRLADVPSQGFPYPVFALAALVPWTFFAQAVSGASESLIVSSNMVSKIYFPRLLLPLAAAGAYVVDLILAMGVLLVVASVYGVYPGLTIVWLPLLTGAVFVTAIAVGMWLSALNVRYRDVKYAVPFLIQLWLFISPVVYPSELVPDRWKTLYALNPMAAIIDGFRWSVLGAHPPSLSTVAASSIAVIAIFVGGMIFFQRSQRTFADVI